jgi:hypothetical protein
VDGSDQCPGGPVLRARPRLGSIRAVDRSSEIIENFDVQFVNTAFIH